MIKPLDTIFFPQLTPLEELCEIFARGYLRLLTSKAEKENVDPWKQHESFGLVVQFSGKEQK